MRHSLILLILLLSAGTIFGQVSKSSKNKVLEEKKSFFIKELDLSKAEAASFWPVYNDYQNRRNKIISEKRTLMKYYSQNARNISDDEITEILNKYLIFEKRETRLLEEYTTKFRTILPDEKVLKIFLAEVRFKDFLLKRLRTN